jgi:hypothetical protein
MAFGRPSILYRSEPVFTPFRGDELDLDRIEELIDGWLAASEVSLEEIFAGGAIAVDLGQRSDSDHGGAAAAAGGGAHGVRGLGRRQPRSGWSDGRRRNPALKPCVAVLADPRPRPDLSGAFWTAAPAVGEREAVAAVRALLRARENSLGTVRARLLAAGCGQRSRRRSGCRDTGRRERHGKARLDVGHTVGSD